MYLSRIMVSGEPVKNPYQMHRTLWHMFDAASDQARDFLFRIEKTRWPDAELLLLSGRVPAQKSTGAARVIASKAFSPILNRGQALRFLLVANPVRKIRDENGRLDFTGEVKKCRVPLIREDQQIAWIRRKLDGAAAIEQVDIQQMPPIYFRKNGARKAGKIQPAAFRGILRILDVDSLQKLLKGGIGPAKAFGCGLLSIAPG